jgi:autoinducer 2-degrading protein
MIANLVYVRVKPHKVEDFTKATIENHTETIKEPGNLRFDLIRQADDETRFVLYEAFIGEAAVAAHKETDHYKKWRDTVADWMVEPRTGVKHHIIAPNDPSQW